ncbi:DUF1007 family protein [bacterium]|nr:DUF1007 family protein [bacterium]
MRKQIFVIILLFSTLINAHPHLFIDAEITVVFSGKSVKGFIHRWSFDEMFSSSMIAEFDHNKDGKFSLAERAKLKKEAFEYTSEQDYFTHAHIGKKPIPITTATDFIPSIEKGVLIYRFFTPIPTLAHTKEKITLQIFDDTYYTSFQLKKITAQPANRKKQLQQKQMMIDTAGYGKIPIDTLIITL